MTEQKRTTGPVKEEARPIVNQVGGNRDESPASKPGSSPVKVDEPAEPIPESDTEEPKEPDAPIVFIESSPWKIAFLLVIVAGVVWLLAETAVSLVTLYSYSIYLGVPAIAFVFLVLGALSWASRREYLALKSIDKLAERDEKIRSCLENNDMDVFKRTIGPVLANIRRRQPELIREYEEASQNSDSVIDSLNQLENIVLARLDAEVNALIKNAVMIGGTAVTVIPHPALDAVFILWRGQNLVRKIGIIYGLEPSGLSSWRLLKHVIASAFIAASIDEFGGIALEQVTHAVFAKALKPMAEGSISALRLYRLGKLAQRTCRPRHV